MPGSEQGSRRSMFYFYLLKMVTRTVTVLQSEEPRKMEAAKYQLLTRLHLTLADAYQTAEQELGVKIESEHQIVQYMQVMCLKLLLKSNLSAVAIGAMRKRGAG